MSKDTHYHVCFRPGEELNPYLLPWNSPNPAAVWLWLKSYDNKAQAELYPHVDHSNVFLHFETTADYFRYCEKILSSVEMMWGYSKANLELRMKLLEVQLNVMEIERDRKQKGGSHE